VAALTFMSLSKFQLGLAGAVIVTGAGLYVVQENTNAALRDDLASVPSAVGEIAGLRLANQRLERAARDVENLKVSDAELATLYVEAVALEQQLKSMARAAAPPPARPAAPAGPTFGIKDLDERPKPTVQVAPVYPAEMAKARIEGRAQVAFVIDSDGRVVGAHAVESSRPEFEAPSVAAVSKWQFDPGRKGGRLVNTQVNQVIEYKLDSQPPADWF